MPDEADLERRVAAVEEAVAELRDQFTKCHVSIDWLEKIAGSISDVAAFEEALEYGRAFRQADRLDDLDHRGPAA